MDPDPWPYDFFHTDPLSPEHQELADRYGVHPRMTYMEIIEAICAYRGAVGVESLVWETAIKAVLRDGGGMALGEYIEHVNEIITDALRRDPSLRGGLFSLVTTRRAVS